MDQHTRKLDMPEALSTELRGETAILRLSRPDKRNAIDLAILESIERFFDRLPSEVRAVVIHGEGEHFSAGVDLAMMATADASQLSIVRNNPFHHAFDRIEHSSVPVIAVLHGAVIGAGLELASSAHIRIAERGAYYGLPEGTRGIFVGGGAAVRVPRLIGVPRMMDMMLTGRTYGAEDGVALGLSQYLVERGEGLAKGLELAKQVATNAPLSNFAILHALPRIARADPDAGFLLESLMATGTLADGEAKLRIDAFLDKKAKKVSHG
jgi:enoyl-CoA hydratase/carnithine racemase